MNSKPGTIDLTDVFAARRFSETPETITSYLGIILDMMEFDASVE